MYGFGLRHIFGDHPHVVCIQQFIDAPSDIERLMVLAQPDLVKIDIEGYEKHLLGVPAQVLMSVKEWLIETHGDHLFTAITRQFRSIGFACQVCMHVAGHAHHPTCAILLCRKQPMDARPHEVWRHAGYAEDCQRRWGSPTQPHAWVHSQKQILVESSKLMEGSVLDVGCGLGHLYPLLMEHVTAYVGVDVPEMIAQAKRYFPNVSFVAGDIYDLSPFGMYDTVCAISTLIHLPDFDVVLQQLWRHTRKRLVFTLYPLTDTPVLQRREDGLIDRWHTKAEVAKALRQLPDVARSTLWQDNEATYVCVEKHVT